MWMSKTATKKGIIVLNAPDGNTTSTAELSVAMLLALARNIPQAHSSLKSALGTEEFTGVEISGKALGIVGIGRDRNRSRRTDAGDGYDDLGL